MGALIGVVWDVLIATCQSRSHRNTHFQSRESSPSLTVKLQTAPVVIQVHVLRKITKETKMFI